MKKKNPLKDILQSMALGMGVLLTIALFSAIGECSTEKHNKAHHSVNDNIQLNEIEQYHLSEGRQIKFIEDIIKQ